ncbi:protein SPT2 homolog [Drosophila serrata]|uniref:protein SPT2 homolog n=1 Tax=Drosophila serrata TaxID=7274 RepID=UPI000A1D0A11|nr:protein SPT2 homolog [Drosophila serrata]
MDFVGLLHYAKLRADATKEQPQDGRFYSTKYSPPKKVSRKGKQLSNNIQKFLKKKEDEEAAAEAEKSGKQNQNAAKMMAKHVDKSNSKTNNNIGNMEKVTNEIAEGQNDDYGYTSKEANVLYEKYLEKVQHVKENKSFAPSQPRSVRDLSGIRERVKAAIDREVQEGKTRSKRSASVMVPRSRSRSRSSCSRGATKEESGSSSSSSRRSRSSTRNSVANSTRSRSKHITKIVVDSKSEKEVEKPSSSDSNFKVPRSSRNRKKAKDELPVKDRPSGSESSAKKRKFPTEHNDTSKQEQPDKKKRKGRPTAPAALSNYENEETVKEQSLRQ